MEEKDKEKKSQKIRTDGNTREFRDQSGGYREGERKEGRKREKGKMG